MTAQSTDADALANCPGRSAAAHRHNASYHFVAGNAGRLESRVGTLDVTRISAAGDLTMPSGATT